MIERKTIFLTGMPGCGKTTLGKELAHLTNRLFIDTDEVIIKENQKTIEDIYAEGGENAFRKIEHELIKRLSHTKNAVICCGGGLPCFNQNMQLMNNSGTTIFLDVPPEEIFNRVRYTDFSGRPLYQDKSPEEVLQTIYKTLLTRRVEYEKAQWILKGKNIDVQTILTIPGV